MPSFSDSGVGYYIAMGAKHENRKNFKEAVVFYEKALNIDPILIELYKKIGDIYHYDLKDLKKAIDMYVRGLELRPDDYGMNLNLMHAYFKINDIENGLLQYEALSKVRKEGQIFSMPVNIVAKLTNNMDENMQIDFCERYLSVNPTDRPLRNRIATIFIDKREYAQAKKHLEVLFNHGYIEGATYFKLAVCDYYIGNYEEALNNFNEADKLGEDVPTEYIEMTKGKIEEE
jgi:tetratricopeptide (TPR) repeat protein